MNGLVRPALGLALAAVSTASAVAGMPAPRPIGGLPAEMSAIAVFYQYGLTANDRTTPAEVLEQTLADGFRSINAEGEIGAADLAARLAHIWKTVPDLKWDPQEVLVVGEKVIVRSIATGTPVGSFLGLELDGSKSFRMDTIDIHTVRDNRIVEVYHLEGWATAIGQLRGQ